MNKFKRIHYKTELTSQEQIICDLLNSGKKSTEIAKQLVLSENTIKTYRHNINLKRRLSTINTNFDYIKSLSLKEMADFILNKLWLYCKNRKCQENCQECTIKWLASEVE